MHCKITLLRRTTKPAPIKGFPLFKTLESRHYFLMRENKPVDSWGRRKLKGAELGVKKEQERTLGGDGCATLSIAVMVSRVYTDFKIYVIECPATKHQFYHKTLLVLKLSEKNQCTYMTINRSLANIYFIT